MGLKTFQMDETSTIRMTCKRILRSPKLIVHGIQIILAIIIMGLVAYVIHHVAYQVLVFTLTTCICTILVCVYVVVANARSRGFHMPKFVLGCYILITTFWIVSLGLVARLAKLWEAPACVYSFRTGYQCAPDQTHGGRSFIYQQDPASYKTFYGALLAVAVLAGFEVIFWIHSTYDIALAFHRRCPSAQPRAERESIDEASPELVQAPITSVPFDQERLATPRTGPQPVLPPSSPEGNMPYGYDHPLPTHETLQAPEMLEVYPGIEVVRSETLRPSHPPPLEYYQGPDDVWDVRTGRLHVINPNGWQSRSIRDV